MRALAFCLLLLVVESCRDSQSSAAPFTPSEMRSHLRSTISLLSESELFLTETTTGSLPHLFDSLHAKYTVQQIADELSTISRSSAPRGYEQAYALSISSLESAERYFAAYQSSGTRGAIADSLQRLARSVTPILQKELRHE